MLSLLEMPFGSPNQKFPMGGMGFEGQQGMGGPSPAGMEMVRYPAPGKHLQLPLVPLGSVSPCWGVLVEAVFLK